MNTNPITLNEIIYALKQLGGEAQAKDIKDKVTSNRGGIPPQYGSSHSYRETIQKKIEDHCPESKNFRGDARFEKVRRGIYRLIDNKIAPSFPIHSTEVKKHNIQEPQAVFTENVLQPFVEDNWIAPEEDDEESFPEGKEIYKLHKTRERNTKVVNLAKKRKLQIDPLLCCEICGFSFIQTYGELGKEFIEAHHTTPLSSIGESETRIEDIALVCSNCHKMLHRRRPWLDISSLKTLLVPRSALNAKEDAPASS